MTAVLLWKEYRQQRAVWYLILLSALLLAVMIFGVLGKGDGWHGFRQDRPYIFTCLLLILATSQGVIAGALLLVEETEAGTAVFLDYLSDSRRQLFANKVLAGIIAVLSQCLLLVCFDRTLGLGRWISALYILGFGLDAFAWGLLAGAYFRSGLVAILASIGMFALSWPISLLLMNLAQVLLSARDSTISTVVGISTRALIAAGVFTVTRYIYCRSDSSRDLSGPRVGRLFDILPSEISALLWLLLRQGRWVLAIAVPVSLLGAIAVSWSPFIIWPTATLMLGLVFGLFCLAPEQPDAVKFLGAQRVPGGRMWTIKVLFWFLTLVALVGLAWILFMRISEGRIYYGRTSSFSEIYWYAEGIGFGNRALLVTIWPLYGFCFGLFFGQLTTRPIIGFFLSLFFAPVFAFLWLLSLLMGGVPVWWVLATPTILLVVSRFLMRPWLSGRLLSARPLGAIALAVALIISTVVAFPWYRTLQMADVGEPFDVAAFTAALDAAKKNEAGQLLWDARVDLKAQGELIEKEFSLPKEVPAQDPEREWAHIVPSQRWSNVFETGWNQKDKELQRWMDRLFEGQWVTTAEKAAQSRLGITEDPRQVGSLNTYSPALHEVGRTARLFAARALQLQAKGESQAALDKLVSALAICRQLRNFAPSNASHGAISTETTVLNGYHVWMASLGPNKELLNAGLLALQKHQAAIPSPVETIKADYLISKRNEPDSFSYLNERYLGEIYQLAYSLPWEKDRQAQVIRAIAAGRLQHMEEFLRTQVYTIAPDDEINYPRWLHGTLGPYSDQTWFAAKSLQNNHMAQLATAVLIFHAASDKLPAKLDELVPKYLAKLPVNTYDGQPFSYRISGGEVIQRENLTLAEGQAVIWWNSRRWTPRREWTLSYQPLPTWAK